MAETQTAKDKKGGVIYILTNPAFPEWIKIGFTTNLKKRVDDLNRSPAVPFAFRVYATYETQASLKDKEVHKIIDILSPQLRAREKLNDKMREREFFTMDAEDAYQILYSIARITGTEQCLKKLQQDAQSEAEENAVKAMRRASFTFSMVNIEPGCKIEFTNDGNIKAVVTGDKTVEYEGETYSLSGLAQVLLNTEQALQGPKYFKYAGKLLTDLRDELEDACG